MRSIHRIGIGILVGVFFAFGYVMRLHVEEQDRTAAALRESGVFVVTPGTRIASINLEGAADVDFRPLQTLLSVLTNLRQHYVDRLTDADEGKMTYEALKSMLGSLNDPNTRFLEPEDRRVLADAQEGIFHGIGAVLGVKRVHTGEYVEGESRSNDEQPLPGVPPKPRPKREIVEEHLVVVATLPGGPAEAAGLRTGDDIIAVNSKQVLPFDPYQKIDKILKDARGAPTSERPRFRKLLEAEQKRIEGGIGILDAQNLLMRGDKDPVQITLVPVGSGEPRKIDIKPRKITVEPVTARLLDGGAYGCVRVNFLGAKTAEGFARAIGELQSAGAKGLVLDLRNLAGGQIDAARQVASWFVPGKPLAVELKSRGRKSTVTAADRTEDVWKKPLVALVDRGTARAAELLAAALRENGVAKLVGEKTYGDMAVTSLMDQPDGSAVVMTTGSLLTGKGGAYAGKGIPVDVEMASGASGEAAVNEAVRLLSAGSREARAR